MGIGVAGGMGCGWVGQSRVGHSGDGVWQVGWGVDGWGKAGLGRVGMGVAGGMEVWMGGAKQGWSGGDGGVARWDGVW